MNAMIPPAWNPHPRQPEPEETPVTETPEPVTYAADVVAVTPDGRLLLIERDWEPFEGHWALPGGHVDPGETSLAAAARELAEETGVHVPPGHLRLIGVFDRPDRDPRGRYVSVAYLAIVPNDTVPTAGDDARSARWWPLDDLPPLAFDHADILAMARPAPAAPAYAPVDTPEGQAIHEALNMWLANPTDNGRQRLEAAIRNHPSYPWS